MSRLSGGALPEWAEWGAPTATPPYSVGIEEEMMLLDPETWRLAYRIEAVLPALSDELAAHATAETHGSALELATGVHASVPSAAAEVRDLRAGLRRDLVPLGLAAASAGTHPSAVWQDTVVSSGSRYRELYGSMRELARREPTFALHVHVGVPDPEAATRLVNALRGHLALFLALSVNSPFWQGRDTGLASARTPLFQAFPRVGIPRAFRDYADYVATVDLMIRCDSLPDPSHLWWDVRPQARFGTVEVRIMDAQTTPQETAALAALVQCVARLEVEQGYVSPVLLGAPEILDENRFLAARDGMDVDLIDPASEGRAPAREVLEQLLAACAPHAEDLGCAEELGQVRLLAEATGAERQIAAAGEDEDLGALVAALAEAFTGPQKPARESVP